MCRSNGTDGSGAAGGGRRTVALVAGACALALAATPASAAVGLAAGGTFVPGAAPKPPDVVLADDASFGTSTITDETGDVVEVTVELEYAGALDPDDRLGAYVFLGGPEAGLLDRVLVVEDEPDADRRVTVRINTYTVGTEPTSSLTTANDGYEAANSGRDADSVEAISRPRPSELDVSIPDHLDEPLGAGTYPLTLSTSPRVAVTDDEEDVYFPEETDEAVLHLRERNVGEGDPADGGPVAAFEISPRRPAPGETVTFDGSPSSSPGERIVSYAWDLDNDGKIEKTGRTVTYRYAGTGERTVGLRVTDSRARQDVVGETFVVNRPPSASFSVAPAEPTVGEPVTVVASASDADGSVASYEWDLDGDGAFERRGRRVNVTYSTPGNRSVTLRVTDDLGGTATVPNRVSVGPEPTPSPTPTATASPSPTRSPTATVSPSPTPSPTPTAASPTGTTSPTPAGGSGGDVLRTGGTLAVGALGGALLVVVVLRLRGG